MVNPLFITPGFPVDLEDTTCIPALQEYLIELGKRGIKGTIVSLNYPAKGEFEWHGHRVFSLGWNNPDKLKKLRLIKRAEKSLINIVVAHQINLIHSFWLTDAGLLAAKVSKKANVPQVVTAMGQDVTESYYSTRILKNNPTVVSISEFQQNVLNDISNSTVIPWGLSNDWDYSRPQTKFDIISVGWLNEVKRTHQVLELAFELKKEIPSLRVAIVGEGEKKEELEKKVSELGLASNVTFFGLLGRQKTIQLIASSKLLFHPSMFEGFGLVLIEALACGTHVVSYDVGVGQSLEGINKISNVQEAVDTVRNILEQNAGDEAFPFKIEKTVSRYLDLYQALI